MRIVTRVFTCCIVVLLAGCTTPMGDLSPAPKWCMAGTKTFPPLKEGDDLVSEYAKLKRINSEDTSKIRCLQRYSRAVSKT